LSESPSHGYFLLSAQQYAGSRPSGGFKRHGIFESRRARGQGASSGAESLNLSVEQIFLLLGTKTSDVYINEVAYWANIPVNVWDYNVGGYQVVKKWLSYREQKILGRTLANLEVRYLQEMIRRIAAIILLAPSLDSNYHAIKSAPFSYTT
jgi:hypothetical protein